MIRYYLNQYMGISGRQKQFPVVHRRKYSAIFLEFVDIEK